MITKDRSKHDALTVLFGDRLIRQLDPDDMGKLYDCLQRAIYGIPDAIDAADLLHALAAIMDKPDPSGEEEP